MSRSAAVKDFKVMDISLEPPANCRIMGQFVKAIRASSTCSGVNTCGSKPVEIGNAWLGSSNIIWSRSRLIKKCQK